MQSKITTTLLVTVVCMHSVIVAADLPHVFEDGKPALAREVNENFSHLESTKGCTVNESGSVLAISCPDGKHWFAEKAPSLPAGAFTFNLTTTPLHGVRTEFQLTPAEPGYEQVARNLRDFGGGIVLQSIEKTRFYNSNFIKSPESGPLHTLCDPDIHIGYLPIEASLVLYAGPNMLAASTKTAEQSKNPNDADASIGCLEPLPKTDPDDPNEPQRFQSTIHRNLTIVNTHGRLSCLSIEGDDPNAVFRSVTIINTPEARERSIDLFGVTVGYLENGVQRFASTTGTFDTDTNVISRSSPSITVPETCP